MKNVYLSIFVLVICFITFLSCEPLAKEKPGTKTVLKKIVLSNKSGIPKEYGTLVSVTTNAEWAQLWFVDEEQTIRKISLNFLDYQLDDTVLVILRN